MTVIQPQDVRRQSDYQIGYAPPPPEGAPPSPPGEAPPPPPGGTPAANTAKYAAGPPAARTPALVLRLAILVLILWLI
ncbi:hypothetical protein LshimejAT787_1801900 [Lyophyllum shimeji]|uniref:Uncharacterized protein n=1 Tax=Lyophyllum shimeji TaxID=47721 RepID=A0A9P3Q0E1_LYOSH|nr:hypothetical protein LshimejAT787_1801900 [Lyophyllum shimeji]